jgi:hypothetical protein
MHHHSTGSSVLQLIVGLALIGVGGGVTFMAVRSVQRKPGGSARWRLYDRRISFPVILLVLGILLCAKGISGL